MDPPAAPTESLLRRARAGDRGGLRGERPPEAKAGVGRAGTLKLGSGSFGPALEFPPCGNPAALDNPTTHAPPQAVNRTGTTPCCRARSRFPISQRSRPLFASKGRNRMASRDRKRSDRRKVRVCFR